jgi:hypothetical protein
MEIVKRSPYNGPFIYKSYPYNFPFGRDYNSPPSIVISQIKEGQNGPSETIQAFSIDQAIQLATELSAFAYQAKMDQAEVERKRAQEQAEKEANKK